MLERDIGIFALVDLGHDLVPEHARLHDVALLHRGHLVLALPGKLEGDAADALDLIGVIDLGIDGALLAVAEIGDGLGLAEIDAAGELTHDDDIEAFDGFALEARGFRQRRVAHGRAEVREQGEILAQAEQAGFGTHLIGDRIPLRTADRAEDDGVGGQRLGHVALGDRHLVGVIGRAADEAGVGLEAGDARLVEPVDQPLYLAHHLGADTVAGEQQQFVGRHGRFLSILARNSAGVLERPCALGKTPLPGCGCASPAGPATVIPAGVPLAQS